MNSTALRPSRTQMFTGYNHTVPIGGRMHDVQTEFIDGEPPRIVSHAFVSGGVVASRERVLESAELQDEQTVRSLIKHQQKALIRQLVIADRERRLGASARSALDDSRRSTTRDAAHERLKRRSLTSADVDLRRALIRFSRSASEAMLAPTPLVQLVRLVNQSAAIFGGDFDRSRSEEAAELLLVHSDSIGCIRAKDAARARELVEEFVRLAKAFADVNHRAELQDHDREQWRRHLESLGSLPADDMPPAEVIQALVSTWGRSLEVDELLDDPSHLRNGALREALASALEQLEGEMPAR